MRAEARYAILVVLVLCVLMALGLSLSGPLLYTLEKDVFPSRFHENTDVLKIKYLNSTSDILLTIVYRDDYANCRHDPFCCVSNKSIP